MVPVYLVNLFWLLYNLIGVLIAIIICFEKQRHRAAERFSFQDPMKLVLENKQVIAVELIDISMVGCAIAPLVSIENADDYIDSIVRLSSETSSLELPGIFFRSRSWGKKIILKFKDLSKEQNTQLLNFIFDRQQSGYGHFNKDSINFNRNLREIIFKWWKTVIQKK